MLLHSHCETLYDHTKKSVFLSGIIGNTLSGILFLHTNILAIMNLSTYNNFPLLFVVGFVLFVVIFSIAAIKASWYNMELWMKNINIHTRYCCTVPSIFYSFDHK